LSSPTTVQWWADIRIEESNRIVYHGILCRIIGILKTICRQEIFLKDIAAQAAPELNNAFLIAGGMDLSSKVPAFS